MQKTIIANIEPNKLKGLDLEALADVEVTSENQDYPIEAALFPGFNHGWHADTPGKQTIRLLFKHPQQVDFVELEFVEKTINRTQEYVLQIYQNNPDLFQKTLRQQWNFSPEGATKESERHLIELTEVSIIELIITPDINNSMAFASLEKMRVI